MSTERSIDELLADFNNKAKAEGTYDGRAFWEVPSQPGGLLDIPETPESRERIEWLKQQIAELQRQGQDREQVAPSDTAGERATESPSRRSAEPTLDEQPSAMDRVS
jgi:hypothetical protein